MAQINPILDRIVVQKADTVKKTESGLYIPDTSSERPDRGVVIAVGPGREDKNGNVKPLQVQAGDTVIFAKNVGQEVKVEGEVFTIMAEADVLAIIRDM
jgi:chaperonin GroES